MRTQLSPEQADRLSEELAAISAGPGDEAHIQFRLAYDAVRRRHMLRVEDGGNYPPAADAIAEAAEIVRKDFPGFTPEVSALGNSPAGVGQQDAAEDEFVLNILAALHSSEPTDSTGLKWELFTDDTKRTLAEKYRQRARQLSATELMSEFRREVDQIHQQRAPQQEQRERNDPDAPAPSA